MTSPSSRAEYEHARYQLPHRKELAAELQRRRRAKKKAEREAARQSLVAQGLKCCGVCKDIKPLQSFVKNTSARDGLGTCDECHRARATRYRDENREMLRAYHRQPEQAQKARANVKIYRQRHPDRHRVQWTFEHALKAGKVVPQPCWVCGEKAEAHHPDYSRPLDVVWLCRPHHRQTHAIVKA